MSKDEAKKEWEAFTSASVTNCQSDQAKLISRLKKPEGKVDVVIDTDTYNEIRSLPVLPTEWRRVTRRY